MLHFGIIGNPLGHSFSPSYFQQKFQTLGIQAEYLDYPIKDIDKFVELKVQKSFTGMNVTIPYKEVIIPYLDDLDVSAKESGAVNTIKFIKNRTIGYNTDISGFEQSLLHWIPSLNTIKLALVLGNGGASKAITYVLRKNEINFKVVSRRKGADLLYSDITKKLFKSCNLIINTTPLGMVPWVDQKPDLPYEWLDEKYFLYDLVYNPEKSLFLSDGLDRGCRIKNGREMLTLQAEHAWQIWNTKVI